MARIQSFPAIHPYLLSESAQLANEPLTNPCVRVRPVHRILRRSPFVQKIAKIAITYWLYWLAVEYSNGVAQFCISWKDGRLDDFVRRLAQSWVRPFRQCWLDPVVPWLLLNKAFHFLSRNYLHDMPRHLRIEPTHTIRS